MNTYYVPGTMPDPSTILSHLVLTVITPWEVTLCLCFLDEETEVQRVMAYPWSHSPEVMKPRIWTHISPDSKTHILATLCGNQSLLINHYKFISFCFSNSLFSGCSKFFEFHFCLPGQEHCLFYIIYLFQKHILKPITQAVNKDTKQNGSQKFLESHVLSGGWSVHALIHHFVIFTDHLLHLC